MPAKTTSRPRRRTSSSVFPAAACTSSLVGLITACSEPLIVFEARGEGLAKLRGRASRLLFHSAHIRAAGAVLLDLPKRVLRHHAVLAAVAEVDHQADDEPHEEADPVLRRER